ncbi:MAG: hypothetical protein MK033_08575 [Candidatus Caenarcaniphilales bacterium]|nr:hypothetical protein [Candidatus Caenarcaniphilales bacterium]
MKFRFISYGIKYYEALGKIAPKHDFLFNLRDLNNPFWVPELKDKHGLESEIHEYFGMDDAIQLRLEKICSLCNDFIEDALKNSYRSDVDDITFAFRCTGGKHRSVYFAQRIFEKIQKMFENRDINPETGKKIEFEVEHIDLPRYIGVNS